jgi:putative tricarboxylic transport membrane protein
MRASILSTILIGLTLTLAGCTLIDGSGNDFPDGPVNIIVGYAKDGGSDQWARSIAAEASKTLGVEVTVTNIPGDGGITGLNEFLTREPDGYTLMSIVDIYAAAFAKGQIQTNVAEDLVPLLVGNMVTSEIYIAPDDPRFQTWDDVVNYARSNPGLKVASAGTPLDLEGLSILGLEDAFNVDLERQIIQDANDRFNAPVTGVTDLLIEQSSDVQELVQNGTLKPVLTLWRSRTSQGVPAVTELAPDFSTLLRMRGLAAHPDVPQDRLDILKEALEAAFSSANYQRYLRDKGMDAVQYPTDAPAAWREQAEIYRALFQSS